MYLCACVCTHVCYYSTIIKVVIKIHLWINILYYGLSVNICSFFLQGLHNRSDKIESNQKYKILTYTSFTYFSEHECYMLVKVYTSCSRLHYILGYRLRYNLYFFLNQFNILLCWDSLRPFICFIFANNLSWIVFMIIA